MDSAAAVQTIKDRHSHADHRIQQRMFSRFGIRLISAYNGYPTFSNVRQVTIDGKQSRSEVGTDSTHPSEELMAEPSYEELKAKLAQLEKEVETKKRSGDLIFKVGEKGGVSVYGLGRFPVTLYYEQWNRLLGAANDIKQFMEENKSKLKLKEQ